MYSSTYKKFGVYIWNILLLMSYYHHMKFIVLWHTFGSFATLTPQCHWDTLNVMKGLICEIIIHTFMTSTKSDQFLWPPPSPYLQKLTIDLLFKIKRILKMTDFKTSRPPHFPVEVISIWFLSQWKIIKVR